MWHQDKYDPRRLNQASSTIKYFKQQAIQRLTKKNTEYCMEQEDSYEKASQEDLINWDVEVWYADKLSPELINKSFKLQSHFKLRWYLR